MKKLVILASLILATAAYADTATVTPADQTPAAQPAAQTAQVAPAKKAVKKATCKKRVKRHARKHHRTPCCPPAPQNDERGQMENGLLSQKM